MPKNRFAAAEVVRLPLTEGDWIEVKAELSFQEARRLTGTMIRSIKGGTEMGIEYAAYGQAFLETYLVDWNFKGTDDKPVTLSSSSIANLDPATADEIEEAIKVYQAERNAPKAVTPPTTETVTS